jgi:hypothetical protein
VDVEWAHPAVLADVQKLLDEAGISGTFFVTHAGVTIPGHERALHPNFRPNGDSWQAIFGPDGFSTDLVSESIMQRFVLRRTQDFAPEAKGVRTHSLYCDSTLLPLYNVLGLEYDSSYDMPLVPGSRPFWRMHNILTIPIYYMDHIDLITGMTEFSVSRLGLDRAGLKVFDFHPNMIYLNAATEALYVESKAFYHEPERLLAVRNRGRGVRTLLLELLDHVVATGMPTAQLGEINAGWRRYRESGIAGLST